MTQPEDPFQQPGSEMPSESSDSPTSSDNVAPPDPAEPPEPADVPEPPARMPGSYPVYSPPPPAEPAPMTSSPAEPEPVAETPSEPAPEPVAPVPQFSAPEPPPVAPAPMPMSTSADHEDTEAWEVPPASAIAGAAAASQWAQPAPAIPQPIVPEPVAAQPAPLPPVVPPPPPPQPYQAPPPPAPAWQQQPQAQQWQQPQQQYQQPYAQPYGQPAAPYAQPYGQQWTPQPGYRTSPLAVFAGLLLVVFGIGIMALGVLALTQGPDIARFIRDNDIAIFNVQLSRDLLRSALSPSPGVLIVLGLLQLIAGSGVMAHKSWGRWLGMLLALFALVVAIFAVSIGLAVAGGFTPAVIIGVVLLVGYVLILLALIAGGGHFRRKVPAAPRQ